jgi:hypothetical protein
MYPLKAHYYDGIKNEDNQIVTLGEFAWALEKALDQSGDGPCLWKEWSPAVLMLLQEERRLAKYTNMDIDFLKFDSTNVQEQTITGAHCSNPEAQAALQQQAALTVPEEPILPYVHRVTARSTGLAYPQASPQPKELRDYVLEERAPGHADDEKVVIFHADLNPENPYYVAMLMVGQDYGTQVIYPEDPMGLAERTKLAADGIYGLTCPAVLDVPPARPFAQALYMNAPGSTLANPRVIVKDETGVHMLPAGQSSLRTGSDLYCSWTVALLPRYLMFSEVDIRSLSPSQDRDLYEGSTKTWYLSEHSFVRLPGNDSRSSLLEIHGPNGLKVVTTLVPAGPNRWHLLPPGQSFNVTITAVAPTAN